MAVNIRTLERTLRDEAAKYDGVSLQFADGGKHRVITVCRGAVSRKLTVSRSPSDVRAVKNIIGDMRRVIKLIGEL